MSLVLTKAAAALKRAAEDFQHVKFEAHKPKRRKSPVPEPPAAAPAPTAKSKELDLKRIRHEVVKFGMSGFDAPKKEEARIALAVSLGAKPPKKEYKNYKELMQQRKEEKRTEKERRELLGKDMMRGSAVGAGKSKKKGNGNDVGKLLNVYGKVDKKKIKERKEDNLNNKKRKK